MQLSNPLTQRVARIDLAISHTVDSGLSHITKSSDLSLTNTSINQLVDHLGDMNMIHAGTSSSRFALDDNAVMHFRASVDLTDNAKMTQSIISKNIKRLLREREWSETRLSEVSGVHQTTINRIVKGQIRSTSVEKLERIAAALNVTPEELTTEPGKITEVPTDYHANQLDRFKVPVLNWTQIGTDIPASIMARKDIICPAEHGVGTFAVPVQGPGMQAPQGRSYAQGSLIFVDPTQANQVEPGDAVIAMLTNSQQPSFRIYYKEGDTEYLMPLNIGFPATMNEPFTIIGKVIGSWSQ